MILAETGSAFGAALVLACLLSHLENAASARSSPMDLRRAFSLRSWPLVSGVWSRGMVGPFSGDGVEWVGLKVHQTCRPC